MFLVRRGSFALALFAGTAVAWLPSAALADGGTPCAALTDRSKAVEVTVLLVRAAGPGSTRHPLDEMAWTALRRELSSTSFPAGVNLVVKTEDKDQRNAEQVAPGTAWIAVSGGVLRMGSLNLLSLTIGFDPGDGKPDLTVDVQGRIFTANIPRGPLLLPLVAVDGAALSAKTATTAAPVAPESASTSPLPIEYLRGLTAYLAYRRLPDGCVDEASRLRAAGVTALRRWDGPQHEQDAADASASSKQLRALLEFYDADCATHDGGEDPIKLLLAASRLSPHESQSRRLAVIGRLYRSYHPAALCGVTLERDLLAGVAIDPIDGGTLRDAGLVYDILAQGTPRPFAAGETVERVQAFRQMRRVPVSHRPSVRGVVEVGLGPLVSVSGARAAPGARLEAWVGPSVVPIAARGAVERTTSRDIVFAQGGIASWRRDSASLGVGYRLGGRGLFLDLFIDGALAAVHLEGRQFDVNRSSTKLDAGGGGGARMGWSWNRLVLSAGAGAQLWALPQWAEVDGLAERHELPRIDLSVSATVSLLSGISVR